jgi:hypothetical protein
MLKKPLKLRKNYLNKGSQRGLSLLSDVSDLTIIDYTSKEPPADLGKPEKTE